DRWRSRQHGPPGQVRPGVLENRIIVLVPVFVPVFVLVAERIELLRLFEISAHLVLLEPQYGRDGKQRPPSNHTRHLAHQNRAEHRGWRAGCQPWEWGIT